MADKITTLKEEMTGNDIYPNVKEANSPDTMSKQFEFTAGIKSPKIIDSTGYNIVKGDTSYVEVGNGSRILRLNGTASRPTYNGLDLALTTDIKGGGSYTAGDGISIENETISVADEVSKEVTFNGGINVKDHIKTPQVANLDGGALVRYKETENASVFGGSGSICVLMGSANRPTYSKNGADFSGKSLALLDDVSNLIIKIEALLPDDPATDGDYALMNNVSSGESTHSWGGVEDVDMVELPAVPTSEDGTYVLKAVVSSGAVTYSWIKE